MPLTKTEASDLKSIFETVVRRKLDLQNATNACTHAEAKLDDKLWLLEHPPAAYNVGEVRAAPVCS